MLGFVGLIFAVIGLIHFYLWKRLVRDPLRPGRARKIGGLAAVLLAVLVPATLIGTRSGYAEWLAWPGYLWLALMFYLLVMLVILEIPRLAINLWIRATSRSATGAAAPNLVPAGSGALASGVAPADGPARATAATSAEPTNGRSGTDPQSAGITSAGESALSRADPAVMSPGASEPSSGRSAPSDVVPNPAGVAPSGGVSAGTPAFSRENDTHVVPNPAAIAPGSGVSTETQAVSRENDSQGAGVQNGIAQSAPHTSRPAGTDNGAAQAADGGRTDEDAAGQAGINRRLLLARGAAIFAGLTAASITGYGVKTALGPPQLDRVQLPLAKLPRAMDGTRLAVVSDIHLGPLTGADHASRIVGLINSVNADIVCVVGDLVDGSVAELGRFAAPLAGIESRRGAYFVTGNHEYYSGYQEWIAEVARLGVRPLRNERLELGGLDLAGVNDVGGADFGDGPDLRRALGDRDTARPVVLMAHQPVVARDAAPYGVDLQVSGHTHGGQMAPFNLLVSLEQPVVSGFGVVDGVPVYVTNGAGFWGPPVRVGAPPQVTVIELRTP